MCPQALDILQYLIRLVGGWVGGWVGGLVGGWTAIESEPRGASGYQPCSGRHCLTLAAIILQLPSSKLNARDRGWAGLRVASAGLPGVVLLGSDLRAFTHSLL